MSTELFSRREVAAIFMVHPLTIRTWEKQGRIKPAFYIGNRPRYTLSDLEKVPTLNQQGNTKLENRENE